MLQLPHSSSVALLACLRLHVLKEAAYFRHIALTSRTTVPHFIVLVIGIVRMLVAFKCPSIDLAFRNSRDAGTAFEMNDDSSWTLEFSWTSEAPCLAGLMDLLVLKRRLEHRRNHAL